MLATRMPKAGTRMTATDPNSLYAAREPVFPRRVSGRFRTLKWAVMLAALGIYYLSPWIRWDRGPNLPDQAILVDLAGRRFFFFWIEIWPYEFYFVGGLLIMAGLGLFLFTSALGRVWCGYACPQTVWTDLFILVERWIEGDRNARVRLWNRKWDFRKLRLRAAKWTVWGLIGLATGGAWIFYFTDAPTLADDLLAFSAHPAAYATMGVLTVTTVLLGGFAREQVCIYMCPWPRIQAAMMDEETITIGYREWRGEPRGKHRKAAGADALGDCIDCGACAAVCPTGIDIRDGQQLACITCGLCIDACDDVMDRIGKPRGLVGYLALADESREREGQPSAPVARRVLRPRTILYAALWSLVGVGLVVALFARREIDVSVAPIRNPVFVTMSDGSIRNDYDLRIRNKHGEDRLFRVSVAGVPDLSIELQGEPGDVATVPADDIRLLHVRVLAPDGSEPARSERTELRFWIEDLASGDKAHEDSVFNGDAK